MNLKVAAAVAVYSVAVLALAARPGDAQAVESAKVQNAVAGSAGSMLRKELEDRKTARARKPAPLDLTALASPAPEQATPRPGIQHPSVPGLSYTLDLSTQFPYGDTGYRRNSLPGGIDAVVFAGPDKYTRLQAGYYSVDEYPIGFDNGIVPSYVNNAAIPVLGPLLGPGRQPCQNLAGLFGGPPPNCPTNLNAQQSDATTQDHAVVLSLSRMIYLGPLPVVLSPTYSARWANVGGGNDTFLAWDNSTLSYQAVHLRTIQTKSILLTVPLMNTPRFFAAYTAGPQWVLNTSGLMRDNHPQLFQIADLRYFASSKTTIFFQPSLLQDYLPKDPYPEHIPTFIAGFSHTFAKPFFIQGFVASGTPTNPPNGGLGVIDLTCVDVTTCNTAPNPRTNTAIRFGGYKATTIILQLGIGTPSVIPL